MATSPLPPSLRALRHVVTDAGSFDVDPQQDPMGFARLMTDSATRGARLDQARDDTANEAMGDLGVKSRLMGQFSRMQGDNARQGFNAQWAPYFESYTNLADNNPGMTVKTDTASMTGVPLGEAPLYRRPSMQLPVNLAAPPPSPDPLAAPPTGFPDLGRRIQTPSMRALAKQGGY